jgi:hypothetical protein
MSVAPAVTRTAFHVACICALSVFISDGVPGAEVAAAGDATLSSRVIRVAAHTPAARKRDTGDSRRFMHGVGVADGGDGKSWIFFSSSGLAPHGENKDGSWPHDVYVGDWSPGHEHMSNVRVFIKRPEAQEPVSIAQNTLGNIFVTFEDGWNAPQQVSQRYGVYRRDLSALKPYPNDVESGGHSGHVAAVGERFVVFYSADWVDGGGVDNLGTGGGVYLRTYDGVGRELNRVNVAPRSREWWPVIAGSPTRALLVWQKYVEGSTRATLEFAMFDPQSGGLDKLGDLHHDIEYYVYSASWASAIKRFLVLTTKSDGKGLAVLIDELGNRTALLDGLPATVREANFVVAGDMAYIPTRDGGLMSLSLTADSITLRGTQRSTIPWGTTGIAGFVTDGGVHFVSLTPKGVREADFR